MDQTKSSVPRGDRKENSVQLSRRSTGKASDSGVKRGKPSGPRSLGQSTQFSRVPMPPRIAFRGFDENAFGGNRDADDAMAKEELDLAKRMPLTEQRKVTKDYIDQKLEEIKKKHRSNTELVERLSELMKVVRMGEASLNVDTLTVTKADAKIVGIIFSEVLIMEHIEVFPDKTLPNNMEKNYINKQKASQRRDQKDMSQLAKISNNINDTYYILSGIGKNL